jgi:hypothetical protein
LSADQRGSDFDIEDRRHDDVIRSSEQGDEARAGRFMARFPRSYGCHGN